MASSVDLGKQLEGVVTRLVADGRYNSRSEVMREGVRLIHERETRLAALDAAISRGLADADAGRVVDIDEAARRLDRRYSGGDAA
ncbi:type II toxin-antitoxin system ParD family antitoxin [Brevundimonas staleyi]|uniref:Type II toxin-antitoxin system ParD family antitoxin n=1 Tax=Brevundimonas staleyi TaxID=74326 RepID=A0ABW0FS09_9CAUL